ncbi:YaeQ family protein [Vibrio ponticus]|uniref:YaeQ family protein n=1 Tax=Vibrio ponticus TaxID=265668 RepID=A0A3N3DT87_9VIBR|nr:YaeQ family protein [Vibrio ponticus]ROV57642.1 YaeQ family protein [Vibrio ponticus]
MALKPTIYKFRIALSDTNRDYYDSLNCTIALHPSETVPRMMARVMAYCLNASPELVFTKGLSNIEEPDLWQKSLDGTIEHWIEVGEPAVDRVKKATRLANKVDIYTFNSKSDVWWNQSKNKLAAFNANIHQFDVDSIEALAASVQRGMDLSVMITGNSLFVDGNDTSTEVVWETLQSHD